MRGLKALVIGMGVLIVAGIVILVVAIVDQAGTLNGGTDKAASAPTAFAPQTLALPAGSEVVETRIGDGRILLRLRLSDGSGRLVLIDAATGAMTGTIELKTP